jgi:hypothetical protein
MERRFTRDSLLPASASEAWAWHARAGALERLLPPWEEVRVQRHEGIGEGDRAELELRLGPLRTRWVAEHVDVQPGEGFTDRMVSGPFASWAHRHRFTPEGPESCRLTDDIRFRLPGGWLGDLVAGRVVRNQLNRTFGYRHATTSHDLAVHGRYFGDGPRRFLVSGSTGLVGTALTAFLSTGGHEVTRLVRGATSGRSAGDRTVSWDPAGGRLDPTSVSGHDVVVHLAGAGIADGRWTPERKALIRSSRVDGTDLLARSLAAAPEPPEVLVCASAVGFYGDRGDMEVDEGSAGGAGFLADTARAWEAAARPAAEAGIRVVFLRFGMVLTPAGGALAKMLPPFRLGLGGPLGDGRQYWTWLAMDDLLAIVLHVASRTDLSGPVNAVSPSALRSAEFASVLGRALGRPAVLPVPAPALRLLFGQMAEETLLAGAKVRPSRLLESGFEFRYPELEEALRHLLGRPGGVR